MNSQTYFVVKTEEGQEIPVRIGDIESPQPLLYERQLLDKRHIALPEFVEERVRIQGVDVRVPGSPWVAGFVGKWKHVGTDFLEVDADLILRDLAPDRTVVRTLVVDLEAKAPDDTVTFLKA